jgi:hypothetical protein
MRELDRTIIPALIKDLQARDPALPGLRAEEVVHLGWGESRELVGVGAEFEVVKTFISKSESWRDLLGSAPRTLIVDMLELPGSAMDYAATRISAARELCHGGTFVLLSRAGHLGNARGTKLRALLATELSLDWIVWCGPAPLNLEIVVARERLSADAVTRLVDGRGLELGEVVGLIESCGRRPGGRGAREAVHRGALPIDQPWTW